LAAILEAIRLLYVSGKYFRICQNGQSSALLSQCNTQVEVEEYVPSRLALQPFSGYPPNATLSATANASSRHLLFELSTSVRLKGSSTAVRAVRYSVADLQKD